MLLWAPLFAGIGLGGVTVALTRVGGVLHQSGTWATTMLAIALGLMFWRGQTLD